MGLMASILERLATLEASFVTINQKISRIEKIAWLVLAMLLTKAGIDLSALID